MIMRTIVMETTNVKTASWILVPPLAGAFEDTKSERT